MCGVLPIHLATRLANQYQMQTSCHAVQLFVLVLALQGQLIGLHLIITAALALKIKETRLLLLQTGIRMNFSSMNFH